MQLGILTLLLVATLFGGGYWYNHIDTVCKVPLTYHVASIDERFGTSADEVKRIAQRAEALWENELGKELFIYDEGKGVPINLVFDDRQANAALEAELREDLEVKEGMSESVATQYEKLISEFRALKRQYESDVIAYEAALRDYNEEVTEWNDRGGAPPHELEKLRETEQALRTEQNKLETQAKNLNTLVGELNRIGARGNSLITDYNTIVRQYNERFAESHEFTQGDFADRTINIYQFDTEDELTIVLAHEFGHALSLDHVGNERSIMYHYMEAQEVEEGITEEDAAEYTRVCSTKNPIISLIKVIGGFM